jgi:hypothetical protein
MFSSRLMRRAYELKAPYLQCHSLFHMVSMNDMVALMPLDGITSIDSSLQYSLIDLKKLKTELKYDVTFWYCEKDLNNNEDDTCCISPLKVIDDLKNEQYKVWYPKPETRAKLKLDKVTYAIKESKMVILGISDEFAQDEVSMQVFSMVKNAIKKSYLIVEFGRNGAHKWLAHPDFASVCSDVRVIM